MLVCLYIGIWTAVSLVRLSIHGRNFCDMIQSYMTISLKPPSCRHSRNGSASLGAHVFSFLIVGPHMASGRPLSPSPF